jgi:hypothetical protein
MKKQKRENRKVHTVQPTKPRSYGTALVILTGVLMGGIAACVTRPSAWMFLFAPIMGAVAAVWLWCMVAQFVLRRQPERWLAKSFVFPIQLALCVPVWVGCSFLMLCLPGSPAEGEEVLAAALGALLIIAVCTVVPLLALILDIVALVKSVRHMKQTPETETLLYREGPFALALLMLFVTIAVCGIGAFYWLV